MPCPVAQLLVRMHRGDEVAAQSLWRTHYKSFEAYARAILPPHLVSHSADIVQSVFCNVLSLTSRRVRSIEDGVAFLLASIRNQCVSLIRSNRRRVQRERSSVNHQLQQPTFDDLDIHGALSLLPRRQREIVVLKQIAELTFDQIERSTGINRNTAASIYRVARERLQVLLAQPIDVPRTIQFKEESIETSR